MSNQYLQWITGKRRGEVESVDLMQDGQTFEDLVLLSNGNKISMTKVGKEFIILPSTSAALSSLDLDMMYPVERQVEKKKNRQQISREHQQIMGMDLEPVQPIKKQVKSSFSNDLLSRSKKSSTRITIDLTLDMPSIEFFEMINKTFDEQTVNEVVDILVDSVNTEDFKKSMRESINKFYEGTK